MNRKPFEPLIVVVAGLAFAYLASYVGIRLIRPGCFNATDGPIAAFTRFYYPLRYIDSDKPEWHSKTQDGWLEVKVDWINVGNGYLYFLWDGREHRAGYDNDYGFKAGDSVLVHFTYALVTLDDFRSRIVPVIDMIKPPNKPVGPNRREPLGLRAPVGEARVRRLTAVAGHPGRSAASRA